VLGLYGSYRKLMGLVIEENTVDDMYLWYMFLDDIEHLVEEFCTSWSNKVKHV
jgi:hypothetical protein